MRLFSYFSGTFTYQEIRELAKIKIHSNDDFINALKRMNKRLSEVNCTIETETDIDSFNLFPLHQYFDIALIFCISS